MNTARFACGNHCTSEELNESYATQYFNLLEGDRDFDDLQLGGSRNNPAALQKGAQVGFQFLPVERALGALSAVAKLGRQCAKQCGSILKGITGGSRKGSGRAPASSAAQGAHLRGQLTAEQIAGGHAYRKHAGEFPGIKSQSQFKDHIEDVILNPTAPARPVGRPSVVVALGQRDRGHLRSSGGGRRDRVPSTQRL